MKARTVETAGQGRRLSYSPEVQNDVVKKAEKLSRIDEYIKKFEDLDPNKGPQEVFPQVRELWNELRREIYENPHFIQPPGLMDLDPSDLEKHLNEFMLLTIPALYAYGLYLDGEGDFVRGAAIVIASTNILNASRNFANGVLNMCGSSLNHRYINRELGYLNKVVYKCFQTYKEEIGAQDENEDSSSNDKPSQLLKPGHFSGVVEQISGCLLEPGGDLTVNNTADLFKFNKKDDPHNNYLRKWLRANAMKDFALAIFFVVSLGISVFNNVEEIDGMIQNGLISTKGILEYYLDNHLDIPRPNIGGFESTGAWNLGEEMEVRFPESAGDFLVTKTVPVLPVLESSFPRKTVTILSSAELPDPEDEIYYGEIRQNFEEGMEQPIPSNHVPYAWSAIGPDGQSVQGIELVFNEADSSYRTVWVGPGNKPDETIEFRLYTTEGERPSTLQYLEPIITDEDTKKILEIVIEHFGYLPNPDEFAHAVSNSYYSFDRELNTAYRPGIIRQLSSSAPEFERQLYEGVYACLDTTLIISLYGVSYNLIYGDDQGVIKWLYGRYGGAFLMGNNGDFMSIRQAVPHLANLSEDYTPWQIHPEDTALAELYEQLMSGDTEAMSSELFVMNYNTKIALTSFLILIAGISLVEYYLSMRKNPEILELTEKGEDVKDGLVDEVIRKFSSPDKHTDFIGPIPMTRKELESFIERHGYERPGANPHTDQILKLYLHGYDKSQTRTPSEHQKW